MIFKQTLLTIGNRKNSKIEQSQILYKSLFIPYEELCGHFVTNPFTINSV